MIRRCTAIVSCCAPIAALGAETGDAVTDMSGQIMRVGLGLVLVVAAILVTAWLARGAFKTRLTGSGPLRILAGLPLGAREKILLVQAGDAQIVVAVAPGRIQTLHVLATPYEEAVDHESESSSFGNQLSRLLTTRHAAKNEN